VFLRPTILQDSGRLVALTRERYMGITALQFSVNRRGELERVVSQPLPKDVETLFTGRTDVPAELREYLGRGRSLEAVPLADRASRLRAFAFDP